MPRKHPLKARLQDDLRGLLDGDVSCDPIMLQLYATDAGPLECFPEGVVWPKSAEDVSVCLKYASEKQIAVHPRGAGTGLAGGALGPGLVLDFTRYMRRVQHVGDDWVCVQPGVVRDRLNEQLGRSQKRCFGPDPGFSPATTMGSVLACDGAGPRWLRYGTPRRRLLGMQVVLADGTIAELGKHHLHAAQSGAFSRTEQDERNGGSSSGAASSIPTSEHRSQDHGSPRLQQLVDAVATIIRKSSRLIEDRQSDELPGRDGYRLNQVLQNGSVDLARMMTGSEGTLGVITEARLATDPLPEALGAAALIFDSLEKAARAVSLIRRFDPVMCELLDRRRLTLLRRWFRGHHPMFAGDAEAVLVIELHDHHPRQVSERFREMLDRLEDQMYRPRSYRLALDETDIAQFRRILLKAQLSLFQMKNAIRPVPWLEDLAVEVEELPTFVVALQNILKRHEITASFSGHLGQGQLQIRPILDLNHKGGIARVHRLVEDICEELFRRHGTLSAEQAYGWLRTPFVPREFKQLYSTFCKIKDALDPEHLLNPGKVIVDPSHDWDPAYLRRAFYLGTPGGTTLTPGVGQDARLTAKRAEAVNSGNLGSSFPEEEVLGRGKGSGDSPMPTTVSAGELPSQLEMQLQWNPVRVYDSMHRCNGCGQCRSRSVSERMCPIFHFFPDERAAPRAIPNLLRGVLEEKLELDILTRDAFKEIADHCVHCHMCRLECPAEVDLPKLAFESKRAFIAAHGLSFHDRIMCYLDKIVGWLTFISCPTNWSLSNRRMRWLMEKVASIPQGRKLPRVAKVSYLSRTLWVKRLARPSRRSDRRVALFVDTYANLFDPKLADAMVRVLEHNRIDVFVPTRQKPSGHTSFACGHLDRAESLARHNTAVLADAVRQGYHILTIEPTSAVCLSEEYRYLLRDSDAELVSANTSDASTYLAELHEQGGLELDFLPMNSTVGYHAPCRSLALQRRTPDQSTAAENLLRLIPGLTVHRLEKGCCGMAEAFGLRRENYRLSLRIGRGLYSTLRDPIYQFGATECNACKMQMEQGTNKPTFHPIKLLAHAYGLMPEIGSQLHSHGKRLIVT
jgi:FAD/FMN-containing dehydrogenase/Fe-S oxidoreductase